MHVPYKSVLGLVAFAAAAFAVIHWRFAGKPAAPASNPPRMLNMLRLEVRLAMPRNTFSVN